MAYSNNNVMRQPVNNRNKSMLRKNTSTFTASLWTYWRKTCRALWCSGENKLDAVKVLFESRGQSTSLVSHGVCIWRCRPCRVAAGKTKRTSVRCPELIKSKSLSALSVPTETASFTETQGSLSHNCTSYNGQGQHHCVKCFV